MKLTLLHAGSRSPVASSLLRQPVALCGAILLAVCATPAQAVQEQPATEAQAVPPTVVQGDRDFLNRMEGVIASSSASSADVPTTPVVQNLPPASKKTA